MKCSTRTIKKAFENATPNVLGSILADCGAKDSQPPTVVPAKKPSRFLNFAASAAALLLLAGIGAGIASIVVANRTQYTTVPTEDTTAPTTVLKPALDCPAHMTSEKRAELEKSLGIDMDHDAVRYHYYGTYEGYDIILQKFPELFSSHITDIAGQAFTCPCWYKIFAHKDGVMIDLSQAYNEGLISKESIKAAYAWNFQAYGELSAVCCPYPIYIHIQKRFEEYWQKNSDVPFGTWYSEDNPNGDWRLYSPDILFYCGGEQVEQFTSIEIGGYVFEHPTTFQLFIFNYETGEFIPLIEAYGENVSQDTIADAALLHAQCQEFVFGKDWSSDYQTPKPDPMIAEMQELLDWRENSSFYNDALISDYATPADINLFYLFYDGFRDESSTPTDAEKAFLDSQSPNWTYMDLNILPTEKMNAVLMQMFGITLDQTNGVGLESFLYFEETDCYYHAHTGTHYAENTVQRVEHQDDGTIKVYYIRGEYSPQNMVLVLKPNGDSYQILSNLPESAYSESQNTELEYFTELFRWSQERNPYRYALGFEYASPQELNLLAFYNGGFDGEHEITDTEWVELSKLLADPENVAGDFNRLPKDKMKAELQAVFGISLEDLSDSAFSGLFYLESTDCYCFYQSGVTAYPMNGFTDIKHNDDGTISLSYESTNDKFVITLRPNGDSYQILSNLPESAYADPAGSAALEIAEKQIKLYRLYRDVGICCDFESTGYEDMSCFLTSAQKEDYHNFQYRILCCDTTEEVRAHIDRFVSEEANRGYPDDKLFTDDNGNLYVIVLPTEYDGYYNIQIQEYSETQIVATAEICDYYGAYAVETFTFKLVNGNFIIESIEREDL